MQKRVVTVQGLPGLWLLPEGSENSGFGQSEFRVGAAGASVVKSTRCFCKGPVWFTEKNAGFTATYNSRSKGPQILFWPP